MNIVENKGVLFFLILPFLQPALIDQYAALNMIFDVYKFISMFIIMILLFYERKLSAFCMALLGYEFVLGLSTLLQSGDYWKFAATGSSIWAFCVLSELALKKSAKTYFETLYLLLYLLITINFILLLLYPDGLGRGEYYGNTFGFLANDNSLAPILIPAMLFAVIHQQINHKRFIATFILLAMISATVLITWSATGVVGWFVFMAYLLLVFQRPWEWAFSFKNCFLVGVGLFFAVVVFRIQEYFAFIIEGVLHKSVTFTGRTFVWDYAMNLIRQSPIWGYGVYSGHGLIYYQGQMLYAHNSVLEVMLQGGVIALILYSLLYLLSGFRLSKCRSRSLANLVSACILSFMVMMLAEAYLNSVMVFLILLVGYHLDEILRQTKFTSFPVKQQEATSIYIKYRHGNL